MRCIVHLARLLVLCSVVLQFQSPAQEYYTRITGIATPGDQKPAIIGNPGMSSSTDIQVYPSSNNQSETSIALNWCNTANMLIGANVVGGFGYSQGYYYSESSGLFWAGGDAIPGLGYYTSDPAVAYDTYNIGNPNGYANGYYNYLEYQGFSFQVLTRKSTNGGVTWSGAVAVPNAGDPDKNHMTTDATMGQYANYLYVGYTDFITFPGSPVKVSRSTNRGVSFISPINISQGVTSLFSQGVNLAVGPVGEVYAVWAIYDEWDDGDPNSWDEEAIGFAKSTNGGATWQLPVRILEIDGIRNRWTHKNAGGAGTPIRVSSFPALAVDRSGGPYHGHLYLVWANKGSGTDKADILLSKSVNGGATWSTPVRVNDDFTSNDQWFPWVTISPMGRITVAFYDSRVDLTFPENQATETWIAQSTNGGQSFENLRVSDVSFVPVPIPNTATGYMGDYIGAVSKSGTTYTCWADNRTGVYQIFVDIHDSYVLDLLNVATSNRSPFWLATAQGTNSKLVYAGGKWHRLFHVNEHIAYSSSADDGVTWTGHALINAGITGWLCNPSLQSFGNRLHVVFKTDNSQIYYLRGTTSGVWDLPRLLGSTTDGISGIALTIDAAGIGHVVYTHGSGNPSGNNILSYATFNTADANPVLGSRLDLASSYAGISSPGISVELNGSPHVLWSSGGEVLYRYRTGTVWSSLANISNTTTQSALPGMVVMNNSLHVVWREQLGVNTEIYHKSKATGGSWSVTQNLSNTSTPSTEPYISAGVGVEPLVVWADSSGTNYDVRYKLPVTGRSGSFSPSAAQSHHPVFGARPVGGGIRVVVMCTDGSSSLYQIATDRKDFDANAKIAAGREPEEKRVADSGSVLLQNSPNPFNPTTTIGFEMEKEGHVELKVFDLIGQDVVTLVDGTLGAGQHHVKFDAAALPSGVYLYRLKHADGVTVRRMVLAR